MSRTLAAERRYRMNMNFSQLARLQEMKKRVDTFRRDHPKFPLFLDAVNRDAVKEGTIIEISVTSPEGKHYETNLKLNRDDLELLQALGQLNGR